MIYRKLTYLLFAFLVSTISQAQQPDPESMNKKELVALVKKKDQEVIKLNRQMSSLTSDLEKNLEKENLLEEKVQELEGLLTETTNRWLKQVFVDKYIKNEEYFLESDIPEKDEDQEEIIKNFEQYNIIIKSVAASKPSPEHQLVINKALDFNKNYLTVLELKKEILPQKYDEKVVEMALKELDSLPTLTEGKLKESKMELIGLLKNYKDRTCILKQELDNYSKVDQDVAKPKYKAFETDQRFKDYPYLIQTLQNIHKNINLYTEDSLPCKPDISETDVTSATIISKDYENQKKTVEKEDEKSEDKKENELLKPAPVSEDKKEIKDK